MSASTTDRSGHVNRGRRCMMASTAAAALLAMTWQPATSQEMTEINFVEAVHNLGYINLYVGQHAGIFEKHGLKLNVSAAGGDTQAFAAVLGKSAQFAIGDDGADVAGARRTRDGRWRSHSACPLLRRLEDPR